MSGMALGLELLQVAEQLAASYSKMRALAQQAGVTDAQLAEADARFAKRVADPLAPKPPLNSDPTDDRYPTKDEAAQHVSAQWPNVVQYADGQFGIWQAQFPLPPGTTVVS